MGGGGAGHVGPEDRVAVKEFNLIKPSHHGYTCIYIYGGSSGVSELWYVKNLNS